MKKRTILFVSIILLPLLGFSQNIENIDYISPFHDGLAAIKKGNQWAFIDNAGVIAIDFRDDIKASKIENENYPIFKNGRCLITQTKNNIIYFGYIDQSGNTVVKPQFLNATNFNNNVAIVLELVKETPGSNNILEKPVVYYKYFEAIINTNGEVINSLSELIPITLSKDYVREIPKITSKLISDKTYAIWSKDKKWEIKKLQK